MGVVPLGISLLRDILPPERLGGSIALMSASMGVGALGLPFSAAVAENTDWRVLFWVAAGLSLLVGVLIRRLVPAGRRATAPGRFDLPGALGLGTGLVALLLAVSKGASWGWGSATTLGLFAAAVVVLLAWGVWELRTPTPRRPAGHRPARRPHDQRRLGPGRLRHVRPVPGRPQLFQLPEATGYGLGQSMMAMGLWMAPAGLMMMVLAPLGAKLSAARGPKVTLSVGALVISAGYGSSLALMDSTWGLLAVTLVCNTGVGLAYGAMPALIMGAVPQEETASANSFNTLMRSIGTSVSAAVIGVVLAQMTSTLGGHALPSEDGFRVAMLIGCGVGLVAAVVAALVPARFAADAVETEGSGPAAVRASSETETEAEAPA